MLCFGGQLIHDQDLIGSGQSLRGVGIGGSGDDEQVGFLVQALQQGLATVETAQLSRE